jgi:hypothetical protein
MDWLQGGKDPHRESIAQRSRRSQRGIWGSTAQRFWWTAWLLGGKDADRGKHRTEVTEGGFEVRPRNAFWWIDWLQGGKDADRGKHRTEVTGGIEVRRATLLVDSMAFGRERPAPGKHRTEVTEVTEGDLRFDRATLFGGQHGFWAGKTCIGESSHRGHGNHPEEELI